MIKNKKVFTLTPKNFGVSSQSERGFTLIELLVVIAIIGLLSTLAVVSLNSAREKSRDAKRVSDIKQIQTALEMYYNDKNANPIKTTAVNLGETTPATLTLSSAGFAATAVSPIYMAKVPDNPTPPASTAKDNYSYVTDATGATYT